MIYLPILTFYIFPSLNHLNVVKFSETEKKKKYTYIKREYKKYIQYLKITFITPLTFIRIRMSIILINYQKYNRTIVVESQPNHKSEMDTNHHEDSNPFGGALNRK